MKIVLAVSVFLLALPAFAEGDAAQRIYDALNVEAEHVTYRNAAGNLRVGATIWEKGVGTIIRCRKIGAVVPNPAWRYSCYFGIERQENDAQRLFEALNVASTVIRNGQKKTVGPLSCTMAANDVPPFNRWYRCQIDGN